MKSHRSSQIDIIIPTYRNSMALGKCLESLEKSTLYPNEIIIVVDHELTLDYSLILSKFEKVLPIKKVINEQNFGITLASEIGVRNSGADWVGFLDHDDELASDAILEISNLILSLPKDFNAIFTNRVNVYENGNQTLYDGYFLGDKYLTQLEAGLNHTYVSHLKVYKRDQFPFLNNVFMDGIQDFAWNLEVINTGKFYYFDKSLYSHNIHPNQDSFKDISVKIIARGGIREKYLPVKMVEDSLPISIEIILKYCEELLQRAFQLELNLMVVFDGKNVKTYIYDQVRFSKIIQCDECVILLACPEFIDLGQVVTYAALGDINKVFLVHNENFKNCVGNLKQLAGFPYSHIVTDEFSESLALLYGIRRIHRKYISIDTFDIGMRRNLKKKIKSIVLKIYINNGYLVDYWIIPRGSKRRKIINFLWKAF